MPPRFISLLIVASWLGVNGWFVYHEFAPRFVTDAPPPFAIDVVDEAGKYLLTWDVFQGSDREGRPKSVGRVATEVKYDQKADLYNLQATCTFELAKFGGLFAQLVPPRMRVVTDNVYRVNREGALHGFSSDLSLIDGNGSVLAKGHVEGTIHEGQVQPEGWISYADKRRPLAFDPVPVSAHGSLLNPLHPVNRLVGLRPGQSWDVPVFHPMSILGGLRVEGEDRDDPVFHVIKLGSEMLRSFFKDEPFSTAHATVLAEPQSLSWDDHEVSCLVVEYRERDVTAHVWVRQSDWTVLQQDARQKDNPDPMILKRRSFR